MGLSKQSWLSLIIVFNVMFSFLLIINFFPIYLNQLGVSFTEIGIIFAVAGIITGLLRYPMGTMVDKYGKKPIILLGAIGYPIFAFGLTLAHSTTSFILLKLFVDIFGAVFWTAYWVFLFSLIKRGNEGRQISFRNIAYGSAAILAPLVAGFVIADYGFNTLFYLSAVIGTISIGLIALIKEPRIQHIEESLKKEFDVLMNKAKFRFLTIVGVLHNVTWIIWWIYMPIYLQQELNFTIPQVGIVLSALWLTYVLTAYPLGRMIDKFHSYYLIIPGFFVFAVLGHLFLVTSNFIYLALVRSAMGFSMDLRWQPLTARLTHVTPKREHGAAVGLFRAINTTSAGVVALAAGYFATTLGLKTILWAGAAASFIFGIILIVFYKQLAGRGKPLLHRHHTVLNRAKGSSHH